MCTTDQMQFGIRDFCTFADMLRDAPAAAACRSGAKAAWTALDPLMSRRSLRRRLRALQLSVAAAPGGGAGAAAVLQALSAEAQQSWWDISSLSTTA